MRLGVRGNRDGDLFSFSASITTYIPGDFQMGLEKWVHVHTMVYSVEKWIDDGIGIGMLSWCDQSNHPTNQDNTIHAGGERLIESRDQYEAVFLGIGI